jgi:hypothetical protein
MEQLGYLITAYYSVLKRKSRDLGLKNREGVRWARAVLAVAESPIRSQKQRLQVTGEPKFVHYGCSLVRRETPASWL